MEEVELRGLRPLRRSAGLTQGELAALAGLNQYSISELERGTRHARPSTLRKIATALDVEVADLFVERELVLPKRDAAPVEQVRLWFAERCGSDVLIVPEEELIEEAERTSVPGILRILQDLSECNLAAGRALRDPEERLTRAMKRALKEARAEFTGRLIALMNIAQSKAQTRQDQERLADAVRLVGVSEDA